MLELNLKIVILDPVYCLLMIDIGSIETIRILHECQVWIDKSVLCVTVWHHETQPSDAKLLPEGQICLSIPDTNAGFIFLHALMRRSLKNLF